MAETTEAPATTTPEPNAATDTLNSIKVSLADLCAKGTSHFAHKNYNEAADYFARASELQAELNGEMDPQNAEVLFLYGRSLFKVGQGKSDVLGGRAGGQKRDKGAKPKKEQQAKRSAAEETDELDQIAEEGVALVVEKNGLEAKQEDGVGPKKPLFQFTGDENFEDSDEEDNGDGSERGEDDEEDDLAAAFEVLDLARVLFNRKLEQPEEDEGKGKSVGDSSMTKHIKERLADTHDLLAEISLENERFPNAVSDFRASLAYKQELYPMESEIIAEAHFKLSLALEFASITTAKDDGDDDSPDAPKETQVDEAMREEAAKELEGAIASTKLKLQNKEVELASTYSVDDNDITIAQITEVKEIIADMEQRLVDLRAPPLDVNVAINGPASATGGVLSTTIGESPAEAQARIEEAKRTATDVTGLVRRKAKAPEAETSISTAVAGSSANDMNSTMEVNHSAVNGSGKRKASEALDADEQNGEDEASKKAKVEDAGEGDREG